MFLVILAIERTRSTWPSKIKPVSFADLMSNTLSCVPIPAATQSSPSSTTQVGAFGNLNTFNAWCLSLYFLLQLVKVQLLLIKASITYRLTLWPVLTADNTNVEFLRRVPPNVDSLNSINLLWPRYMSSGSSLALTPYFISYKMSLRCSVISVDYTIVSSLKNHSVYLASYTQNMIPENLFRHMISIISSSQNCSTIFLRELVRFKKWTDPLVHPDNNHSPFLPPVVILWTPSAPADPMAVIDFCWFLILLHMTIMPFSSQVANCVFPTLMISKIGAEWPLKAHPSMISKS